MLFCHLGVEEQLYHTMRRLVLSSLRIVASSWSFSIGMFYMYHHSYRRIFIFLVLLVLCRQTPLYHRMLFFSSRLRLFIVLKFSTLRLHLHSFINLFPKFFYITCAWQSFSDLLDCLICFSISVKVYAFFWEAVNCNVGKFNSSLVLNIFWECFPGQLP